MASLTEAAERATQYRSESCLTIDREKADGVFGEIMNKYGFFADDREKLDQDKIRNLLRKLNIDEADLVWKSVDREVSSHFDMAQMNMEESGMSLPDHSGDDVRWEVASNFAGLSNLWLDVARQDRNILNIIDAYVRENFNGEMHPYAVERVAYAKSWD